jgi:hypothetical protein
VCDHVAAPVPVDVGDGEQDVARLEREVVALGQGVRRVTVENGYNSTRRVEGRDVLDPVSVEIAGQWIG